jgi:hypothetical protein
MGSRLKSAGDPTEMFFPGLSIKICAEGFVPMVFMRDY